MQINSVAEYVFYRLFVTHSHIFDACSLSGHGHFNDRNTDYPKHVLHFLQGEKLLLNKPTLKCASLKKGACKYVNAGVNW